MNGASDEDDILKFFSWNGPYYDHTKNQPRLSPRSGFFIHLSFFWPFSLCQPWLKIIQHRIWVIILTKSAKLSVLEVPSVRNNSLLLDTFCTFKNPIEPLRERFIEKKEEKNRQMSVLPLHLPTYSKNRHFSFFPPYMSQDASKFLPIVGLFLSFLPNLLVFFFLNFQYPFPAVESA